MSAKTNTVVSNHFHSVKLLLFSSARSRDFDGNDSKQPYFYNCYKYFYEYVSIVVINVRNLFSNSKFPFLSSSCCLLWKFVLSEPSLTYLSSCCPSFLLLCEIMSCLYILSHVEVHLVWAFFLLWELMYEPLVFYESSFSASHSLLVWVHVRKFLLMLKIIFSELFFFWGSSCWPRTSFCVNFTTRMFVLLLLLVSRPSPLITYF